MLKKTILALATVAGLVGVAGFVDATPAAAQPFQHRFPQMQGAHPGHPGGFHSGRPGMYRPPAGIGHRPPGDWHRGDWQRRRWHGRDGSWGGVWLYPPGLYGSYGYYDDGYYDGGCRIVKKRVRVHTADGWRLRWRSYRMCY